MHRITSGEIPKTDIYDKKFIVDFLEILNSEYAKSKSACIYQNKKIINETTLNFLNIDDGNAVNRQLKHLLRKNYDDCEKIYPFLGDLFLCKFFNNEINTRNTFLYNRTHQEHFLNSLTNSEVSSIACWFFESCSIERNIVIEKTKNPDITIKKQNDVNFVV